jgi:hypothetical protein
MRARILTGAALAAALLIGGAGLAADLQSGPQENKQIPGPFHPLNINGRAAGQKFCQV